MISLNGDEMTKEMLDVIDGYIIEASARMLGSNWRESSSDYIVRLAAQVTTEDILDHVKGSLQTLCERTEQRREELEKEGKV